ncbi:ClC family H(+)/Cl(-) exchange transporter [Caldicellulosiruptor changbaiensis]|uniref:ClC family H(+)/Cl(-) exchange transporter n=1 Tax=Caldicellulosiruptor changbaiensis TaxID=1222016 RepID=A0A3T0D8K7_9FIRM|nr:ClC family H(+)/Cl(-) exchange transporter [Caldicellulosiruptor changbaiensis]AZT91279.1 ClC family H(+)/Cl(-) exchange transporter [Caldicellulosiruptor changbaiensis]
MSNNDAKSILHNYWSLSHFKIIVESTVIGFVTGILIVLFRLAIEKVLQFSLCLYSFLHIHPWLIPIWSVFLILFGLIIGFMVQKEPMIAGSGIPQVKGILIRRLEMSWWKVIIGKFFGAVVGILGGLSLGREGPSVQIGAAVGQGFGKLMKRSKLDERLFITCGASAGLAAAFNAPFAGLMFALEEIHKNFSPLIMVYALVASIVADFVSANFFGLRPVFRFKDLISLPLDKYFVLIILGIITGIFGVLFNKVLLATQKAYQKLIFIPANLRPIIAFLIAGLVGYSLPDVLGGGHDLISKVVTRNYSIRMLIILLMVKFLFTMISYGSSTPGGIFLPLLSIGALTGAIYGKSLTILSIIDKQYITNLIIFAMAGYFSAIVKAPVTGIILIVEMTGSFSHLLSVSIVCLVAYIISDILNSRPIYEQLLERILSRNVGVYKKQQDSKIVLESFVCVGSQIENKKIKEIKWTENTLVVAIRRGGREIIPRGNTEIWAGDCLVLLVNENKVAEVKKWLENMIEGCKM